MRRKILGIILISLCMSFVACSGSKEKENSENMSEEQEVLAEEMTVFENEMYDSAEVEEPEDMAAYGEESWKQEAGEQEREDAKVTYNTEDYGIVENYGGEFYYEENVMGFYYNVESFYLNSDFLYTMNDTLERIYDDYLSQYQATENWYMEQGVQEYPEGRVPYSEFLFLGVQYVDHDYVSLLFNDVSYMGGVSGYSFLDAVTIDRHTGEEVNASEVLGESDEEILVRVNELMGLEEETDWGYLDFYLQQDTIVFFYRMPGFWDDVVLGR